MLSLVQDIVRILFDDLEINDKILHSKNDSEWFREITILGLKLRQKETYLYLH